jgi:hypothetical protein
LEHKLAAFTFHINRVMITLPITEQAKQQDWDFILTMAKINGYSQSEKRN